MVSRQKTLRALTGTRSAGQRDGDLAEKQKSTTGNPSLREVIMRLIVRRIRRTRLLCISLWEEERLSPFTITLYRIGGKK